MTLRAAHDLDLRVRVFGGRTGKTLRMGANSTFRAGEAKSYNLSLNGPVPSFTLSWVDSLGQSGAVSLKSDQLPYPLPQARTEGCATWRSPPWIGTPGRITGVVASECITETRHEIDLPVYGGHYSRNVPALLDASVDRITGTVNVVAGSHRTTASFVQGGETRFSLPVANRKAVHNLEITADLAATLNVPLPPMLQTTHRPARTDRVHPQGDLSLRREHSDQDGAGLRLSPGARAGRGDPARSRDPHPHGVGSSGPGPGRGSRRPLPVPPRAPARAPAANGGTDARWRFQLVELAVVGRAATILLSSGAALASIAAAPEDANREMLGRLRRGADRHGLCRGGPVLLRHRLGGVRADGRGRRGTGARAGGRPGTLCSWPSSAWWWCCWPRASPPPSPSASSPACNRQEELKEMKPTLPNIRKLAGRGRTEKSANSGDINTNEIANNEAAETQAASSPVPVLHAVPPGGGRPGAAGRGEAGGAGGDGSGAGRTQTGGLRRFP